MKAGEGTEIRPFFHLKMSHFRSYFLHNFGANVDSCFGVKIMGKMQENTPGEPGHYQ
ncbi:MAG TPA: hypothetical protein VKH37_11010 [Ferruginibacter sp.]|nr:hypothetical protein [Ferruginibacter sp.]